MYQVRNKNTGNVFSLPKDDAIELFNSNEELFEIIDNEFQKPKAKVEETGIYKRVVVE